MSLTVEYGRVLRSCLLDLEVLLVGSEIMHTGVIDLETPGHVRRVYLTLNDSTVIVLRSGIGPQPFNEIGWFWFTEAYAPEGIINNLIVETQWRPNGLVAFTISTVSVTGDTQPLAVMCGVLDEECKPFTSGVFA